MSWLARTIANSLRLDEEEYGADEDAKVLDDAVSRTTSYDAAPAGNRPQDSTLSAENFQSAARDGVVPHNNSGHGDLDGDDNPRGVKEDLSELKDSLTRQLQGVASFLSPPPQPPPLPPLNRRPCSVHLGTKSDATRSRNNDYEDDDEFVEHVEIESGRFGELPYCSQSEDYYTILIEEAIGITEEVLAFTRNIAHHPETWLDFPLSEEEEFDGFDKSDAQYKHTVAVEHLAPRLAALRIELCPVHMSEGYFWMVYFVLLHSRLNKHDADLLSSPQIIQARFMWMQELQKRTTESSSWLRSSTTFHSKEWRDDSPSKFLISHCNEDGHLGNASHEMEAAGHEIKFIDKSEDSAAPDLEEKEMIMSLKSEIPVLSDDGDDDWLKEDSDLIVYSSTSVVINEEDISFSDLEDDDLDYTIKYKIASIE